MKIGLLTTSFPRFEGDPSGAFVRTFARAMLLQGHQVHVLAPAPRLPVDPSSLPPQADRPHDLQVSWLRYAVPRSRQTAFYDAGAPDNLKKHPTRWLGAASFCAALYHGARTRLDDYDALVSHWCLPCGVVASAVARGRPHLSVCHATDIRWLERLPGRRAVAQHIVRGASAMWFLTPELHDRFAALGPWPTKGAPQVHIGPMGIEPPDPQPNNHHSPKLTVLFLGRLVPIKGADVLLQAVAQMKRPVQLRIAGDGPERARLERLATRLEVDAVFEGWVSGEKKESLLGGCDVLAVPSRSLPGGVADGVPTVLFEAMARGVPVIASASGGIGTYIRDGVHGLLVPPGRADALASALDRFHEEPHLRGTLSAGCSAESDRYLYSALAPVIDQLLARSPGFAPNQFLSVD